MIRWDLPEVRARVVPRVRLRVAGSVLKLAPFYENATDEEVGEVLVEDLPFVGLSSGERVLYAQARRVLAGEMIEEEAVGRLDAQRGVDLQILGFIANAVESHFRRCWP